MKSIIDDMMPLEQKKTWDKPTMLLLSHGDDINAGLLPGGGDASGNTGS